jgi:hypothetical protein
VTAAETLLERFQVKGIAASVEGSHLILRPASALSPEELEQARLLKAEIMRLLTPSAAPPPTPAHYLRLALRRWFELTVAEEDGVCPDLRVVEALYQEIVRRTDDTGVLYAEALTLEGARRFRSETGRCGWCGRLEHENCDE